MSEVKINDTVKDEVFKKFLMRLGDQTLSTFNYFGDISSNTINEIVNNEITRKDKLKFFTYFGEELIGYGFLSLFEKPSKKHSCILGIVIDDNWQKKGYGRKICEEMIRKAWKGNLEKIWLTVHLDNTTAIGLYKKLGFKIEGIFMNDELIDGNFRTIVSMALFKNENYSMHDRIKIWKSLEEESSLDM